MRTIDQWDEFEMPSNEMDAAPSSSASVEFMLAELSLAGELWRHTDTRIETSVNLYLTVAAVLGPGSLVFYQAFSEVRLLVGVSIPVGLIFIFMGMVISRRVRRTHELKEMYAYATGLIRRYFIDADPKLSRYVHLPVAGSLPFRRHLPFLLKRLVMAVRVINSIAAGWIAGALIWLTLSSMEAALLVGGIVAVVTLVIVFIVSHKAEGEGAHNPIGGADGNRASALPPLTS